MVAKVVAEAEGVEARARAWLSANDEPPQPPEEEDAQMKGQLAEAARAAERLAIARARMAEERASLEASEQAVLLNAIFTIFAIFAST